MNFSLSKKSFGLTEVLVSALILSTVMAGFFATFVATRKYVNRSSRRTIAVNYIRSALSYLYNDVREDTWDTSNLKIGNHNINTIIPISDSRYSGNYSVTDSGGYRQVAINVNYPVD